jgi:sarcosine oxidase subunit beta
VPFVNPSAAGGVFFHFGGQANPQRTVQAYAWAVQDHGGRVLQHAGVTGFTTAGGRVTEVQTTRGAFGCDRVVIAAGPQTAHLLAKLGIYLPLGYARVEMIVTEPLPLIEVGGADGNGLYGRQTLRGNLAYGGGPHEWIEVEDGGTPRRPTTPLLRNLARRLVELFPKVAHVRMLRSWAGVVENTPDGRPVLDRLSDPDNVVVATMSSVGFGLSPASGHAVADLVRDGACSFADLSSMRLDRFANHPRGWRAERGWLPAELVDS